MATVIVADRLLPATLTMSCKRYHGGPAHSCQVPLILAHTGTSKVFADSGAIPRKRSRIIPGSAAVRGRSSHGMPKTSLSAPVRVANSRMRSRYFSMGEASVVRFFRLNIFLRRTSIRRPNVVTKGDKPSPISVTVTPHVGSVIRAVCSDKAKGGPATSGFGVRRLDAAFLRGTNRNDRALSSQRTPRCYPPTTM